MTSATATASGSTRWFLRLPAIILLIAIAVGQVLIAMIFLRSAGDGTNKAEAADPAAAQQAPAEAPKPEPAHEDAAADHGAEHEVDLGMFSMTVPQPKLRGTLLISFRLYGTIDEHKQPEFSERFQAHTHRIRQDVLFLMRSATIDEMTEAGLETLKKRLLDRINRSLGPAKLSDIIFSEFAILEH
jgi:flagellar basal body-associated protein FliL